MKRSKLEKLTFGAILASAYIVLTLISNAFGLANSAIQFRLSESLTVFAFIDGYSIIGLTIGCLLANILTGASFLDVIFGSLATLIGAIGTYYIGKKNRKLLWLPPVVSNVLIIPLLLRYVYEIPNSYFYFVITILIGELLMCLVLGMVLYKMLYGKIKFLRS